MSEYLAYMAIVVEDYDEAIAFYTDVLGFRLIEDTALSPEKRWVVVAPSGSKESGFLLAKAANDTQKASIGNQSGGRVFLFLFTNDFEQYYRKLVSKNVEFVRLPEDQPHGRVAVFKDLYGNLWDLIEPNESNKGLNIRKA